MQYTTIAFRCWCGKMHCAAGVNYNSTCNCGRNLMRVMNEVTTIRPVKNKSWKSEMTVDGKPFQFDEIVIPGITKLPVFGDIK